MVVTPLISCQCTFTQLISHHIPSFEHADWLLADDAVRDIAIDASMLLSLMVELSQDLAARLFHILCYPHWTSEHELLDFADTRMERQI